MNWQKKITKFLSAIFLLLFIFACDGDGCIEADEFDNEFVKVDSNPVKDGVYGSYDNNSGGQTADWHSTGLTSNGEGFLIYVSGAWTPWFGTQISDTKLAQLNICKLCAKRGSVTTGNCICYQNQNPQPEIGINGSPVATNCSLPENQNDPSKCTCTTFNGKATDYGVFHFPLTFYNKDHTVKLPDEQSPACKYTAGMGLYLGLFGRSGSEIPTRVYHLFSEKQVCPISRNSNGLCIDSQGYDRTKYVFRSANERIFVKDDFNGNDGSDVNGSDDEYHKANEYVKLIVHDQYYSDNYGQYNVTFLRGIARDGDTGLLEFLVKNIEDSVLGTKDENGVRHGSIIEYMYKAIVQDSYFAATLQVCLVLYIAFFGLASLFGLTEISSKKELMSRTMKIGLIIFFTNPNSWYFYNQIIVSFFKDGMDFLVTFITNLGDSDLDDDTNPIKIAEMARATEGSKASRFSYIDSIIKMLFSENVTKKIWGLFFATFFGFLYILIFYLLIAYFVYVMLLAATIYAITLAKLVFGLALGPLFICFSLFPQTSGMFKKWVAFLGTRSMEIVLLFLILYPFVMLIDKQIVNLLSFRTCYEHFDLGLFSFTILKSHADKDLSDWLHDFITIGGLLFILQMILDQVPKVSEALITINGTGGDSDNKKDGGTSSMANSIMNFARNTAYGAATTALSTAGGLGFRGARFASRKSGISGAMDSLLNKIPIRGPRARLRDSRIDQAIKEGKQYASKKGLTGAAFDAAVRNFALNDPKVGLNAYKHSNRTGSALLDLTRDNIDKRFDQKLVKEPLKAHLKKTAKELKSVDGDKILLGRDAKLRLQAEAKNWAAANLANGVGAIDKHLNNLGSYMDKKMRLSADEAAKKFAGSEADKNRYLQHLQLTGQKGKKDFVRKTGFEEGRGKGFIDKHLGINTGKGWSVIERIGMLDRYRSKYDDQKRDALIAAQRDWLNSGKAGLEKDKLKAWYDERMAESGGTSRRALARDLEKSLGNVDKDYNRLRDELEKNIRDQMKQEMAGKTAEERRKMQEQAQKEFDDIKAKQLAEIEKSKTDANLAESIRRNGGLAAMRDGLTNIDGDSAFEAKARLDAFGAGTSAPGGLSLGNQPLTDGIGNIGGNMGNVGGNLSFGGNESRNAGSFDQAVRAAFEARKTAADHSRKASKDLMKLKEYEIEKLEKAKDGKDHSAEIKKLEAEKEQAKSEMEKEESQIQYIDQQISNLNKL